MTTRFTDSTQDRCKEMLAHIQQDIGTGQPRIDNANFVPVNTGNGMVDA